MAWPSEDIRSWSLEISQRRSRRREGLSHQYVPLYSADRRSLYWLYLYLAVLKVFHKEGPPALYRSQRRRWWRSTSPLPLLFPRKIHHAPLPLYEFGYIRYSETIACASVPSPKDQGKRQASKMNSWYLFSLALHLDQISWWDSCWSWCSIRGIYWWRNH